MENVTHQESAHSNYEANKRQENNIIAVIAVIVMIGFLSLLGYMFFGY